MVLEGPGGDAEGRGRPGALPAAPSWRVWHAGALLCGFVLVQIVLGLALGHMAAGLAAQLLVSAASYAVFVPFVFAAVRCLGGSSGQTAAQLGFRRPRPGSFWPSLAIAAGGAAAFLAVTFALAGLLHWFGLRWDQFPVQPLVRMIDNERSSRTVAAAAVLATVGAPLAEEILFRSVLYLPLRARMGAVPSALIVSAVFAAFHVYPFGMAHLFVLSLTFVALFECTGSLWVPMAAHGLYNGLMIALVRIAALPLGLPPA